jgi:trehalose 6-phosphate synthase
VIPLVDKLTLQWFVRDLDIRTSLITRTIQEPLADLIREGSRPKIIRYFDRLIQDERLFAIGYCDPQHKLIYKTVTFPATIGCTGRAVGNAEVEGRVVNLDRGLVHVGDYQLEADGKVYGRLVLVHDMSFVQRRSDDTKKYIFWLFAALAAIISLVTVVIAEVSWRGWVAGLKAVIRGETFGFGETKVRLPELRPVAQDIRALVRELESERKARDEAQINWSAETLRAILRNDLKGEEVLIVSNREPYIHVHRDKAIEVQRPASGVVTALEPIMRACSGTWIAHGGGSADRETVDATDHVRVPPERPAYRIRRVWLSEEEEAGYYYGFSNSGLWPLCHIAHTRPIFRTADWNAYVTVNRRFADTVVHEAKTADPIVLVQDYHFALLPRMIRERIPDTIDRYVEARIDRETNTISYGGDQTAVRRYPISIEWPLTSKTMQKPVEQCRAYVREKNGLAPDTVIGIGVDRLDYTKGILERFLAVERLLELDPLWIGKFVFVQIAAPSRAIIDEYQDFDARVRAQARRINEKFAGRGRAPILLRIEHHDPDEVYEYYRASDVCFVSSLHDGMNLVAKEFVASRDDERGVLILSQFTGASRELPEALIVNPYDIDQCAGALRAALMMPPAEQRDRMRSMRGLVQDFNVYRWAGRMLIDAGQMRMRNRLFSRSRDRKSAAIRAV